MTPAQLIDKALVGGGIDALLDSLAGQAESTAHYETLMRECAVEACLRLPYPDVAYVLHESFNCLARSAVTCH